MHRFGVALATVFTLGCLLSGTAVAVEPCPSDLQGYNNLTADLNYDGVNERVTLSRVKREKYRDGSKYDYFIVASDKQGNTIFRSKDVHGVFYGNDIKHCLLHDIDGDGNIELVFSGWNCQDDSDGASNTEIFRWQDGSFVQLDPMTRVYIDRNINKNFAKVDANYYDRNDLNYSSMSLSLLDYQTESGKQVVNNLRKVNGVIWGDIIRWSVPSGHSFPQTFKTTKADKYIDHPGHTDMYNTIRLVPANGGMRVAGAKN